MAQLSRQSQIAGNGMRWGENWVRIQKTQALLSFVYIPSDLAEKASKSCPLNLPNGHDFVSLVGLLYRANRINHETLFGPRMWG